MANLLSQNIGTNYKGFLNLDSTINTPLDATLRAVTDGMGNVSPLQLSTDQVGLIRTVNLSAGATNPRLFNEVYTINNSGAQTGTLTGIFLNATETALNGITHNLMDLQVGGVSKVRVPSSGLRSIIVSGQYIGFQNDSNKLVGIEPGGFVYFDGANKFNVDTSGNGLFYGSLLRIGGLTTSAAPMLKRNGAALDFRLADDSGFCNITSSGLTTSSITLTGNMVLTGLIDNNTADLRVILSGSNKAMVVSSDYSFQSSASTIFEVKSTTKGFLPPRMTTTQKNAIASPATGLVVFDTTLNKLAVFTTVWETITSV